MNLLTNIILFLIMANPSLLLPLPKNDTPESTDLKQFLTDKKEDIHNNTTNSTTEVAIKRDWFHEIFCNRNRRSDNDAVISLRHRPQARQTMDQQFDQKYLTNNQHASNLDHLLWQHFHHQNFRPQLPPSALKSSPLNPPILNHANTLLSQETSQIDPIYLINKPTAEATGTPSSDNVFIDLLHNQPSITGSNTNRFGSLPKISKPHFDSYLTGFLNSVKEMTSNKDCSLIVKTLPVLLINNFIKALTTFIDLQLTNNLMIPFVVLSVMNFITSFLFLEEYCPGSS